MDTTERLLIERECQRLVTEYCHLVDHGEAERIADLGETELRGFEDPVKLWELRWHT